MKKYALSAVVDGQLRNINRLFATRRDAMNYIYGYYQHLAINFIVNDEYYVNNNRHDIEYVYDYNNRFRVYRA